MAATRIAAIKGLNRRLIFRASDLLPPKSGQFGIETGRPAKASSCGRALSGKRSRPMVACQKEAREHHLNPSNCKCWGQGQRGYA